MAAPAAGGGGGGGGGAAAAIEDKKEEKKEEEEEEEDEVSSNPIVSSIRVCLPVPGCPGFCLLAGAVCKPCRRTTLVLCVLCVLFLSECSVLPM